MSTNNFVSQLTRADFLEFMKVYMNECKDIKEHDVHIVRMGSIEGDTDPGYKVIFQPTNIFGRAKKAERKEFYFHSFRFDESTVSLLYNRMIFTKERCILWRRFMAEKFGFEYVKAYEEVLKKYLSEERTRLDTIEEKVQQEVSELMENKIEE